MKFLVTVLVAFAFTSTSMASGLNCKNEAAGHALTQMISEVVKAGKDVSIYKFHVDRTVTDLSVDLNNGDTREHDIVTISVFDGSPDSELGAAFIRTVKVDMLQNRAGDCKLEKTYPSDGE